MKKNLSDAFVHNLHKIYFIEKSLVKTLKKLSEKVNSDEIRRDLDDHLTETIGHVENVEKIFELAGMENHEMKTEVLNAMDKELASLLRASSSEAKDFFILQAAAQTERIEMSYYEAIILAIKDLDIENKDTILGLLRENLVQEEAALDKVLNGMKSQVSLWRRTIH